MENSKDRVPTLRSLTNIWNNHDHSPSISDIKEIANNNFKMWTFLKEKTAYTRLTFPLITILNFRKKMF